MTSSVNGTSANYSSGAMHKVQTTAKAIRYHTTESRRLVSVTLDGLSYNGVESHGLGHSEGGIFILDGGLRLTPHAAAQVPQFAGGTGLGGIAHMDRRTVSFLDRANVASPAGYKGHPPLMPSPRHDQTRGSGLLVDMECEALEQGNAVHRGIPPDDQKRSDGLVSKSVHDQQSYGARERGNAVHRGIPPDDRDRSDGLVSKSVHDQQSYGAREQGNAVHRGIPPDDRDRSDGLVSKSVYVQ